MFIDAIHVKVCDGQVANRPVYAAIGVTVDGHKDVLGLWMGNGGEGSKFWMSVLVDLKNRGVADVFFLVYDGMKGLPDVVANVWPQTVVQTCSTKGRTHDQQGAQLALRTLKLKLYDAHMALLHNASLHPTKLELLSGWLPSRSWYTKSTGDVLRVASFRFDDPADAVGIETILVRVGDGPVHQVPLTYREAPLENGDNLLLGTAEHSVLGKRWVYDGTGDPVYAAALASAILENTGQAAQFIEIDGQEKPREPDMTITSNAAQDSKAPEVTKIKHVEDNAQTLIVTNTVELAVIRHPNASTNLPASTRAVLTGTWPNQPTPLPLAYAIV